MSNAIVNIIGWRGALIHGNTKVLDRWRFIYRRLPAVADPNTHVLEVGCGTGGLSMGAASRGYQVMGLSWDERNQKVAEHRARLSKLDRVQFPICDVRELNERDDLLGKFDVVICCEVVEHVLDDFKLMRDMARCLKPGGQLLLTTPNYYYRSAANDQGPWSVEEDGGHVRRGYTRTMIHELAHESQLEVEELTYVSHFFSQVVSRLQRRLIGWIGNPAQWVITLPLRAIPLLFDSTLGRAIGHVAGFPGYSIGLVACKPRRSVDPN